MGLSEHYLFNQEGLEDNFLWRYTGLSKFLSLLHQRKLFFASVENMAKDDDVYEGSLPKNYMDYLSWSCVSDIPIYAQPLYEQYLSAHKDSSIAFDKFIEGRKNWLTSCYANRRASYISCWHANERESDATWKLLSLIHI